MKTYSAGMSARLAFGISTAIQHDILLIDEGIGAGDATFRTRRKSGSKSCSHRTRIVCLRATARH